MRTIRLLILIGIFIGLFIFMGQVQSGKTKLPIDDDTRQFAISMLSLIGTALVLIFIIAAAIRVGRGDDRRRR